MWWIALHWKQFRFLCLFVRHDYKRCTSKLSVCAHAHTDTTGQCCGWFGVLFMSIGSGPVWIIPSNWVSSTWVLLGPYRVVINVRWSFKVGLTICKQLWPISWEDCICMVLQASYLLWPERVDTHTHTHNLAWGMSQKRVFNGMKNNYVKW